MGAESAWGRDGVSARRCGKRNRNSTAVVAQKTHANSGNTRGKWRDVTSPARGLHGERHGERARRDWGRERGSATARRKSTRRHARAQKDAEAAGVRTAAGAVESVAREGRERGAAHGRKCGGQARRKCGGQEGAQHAERAESTWQERGRTKGSGGARGGVRCEC